MSDTKASEPTDPTQEKASGKTDPELRKDARDIFRQILDTEPTRPPIVNGKTLSIRVSDAQEKLLHQCVEQSAYENISEYIINVALGWDRNGSIIARAGVVIHWLRTHLEDDISQAEWEDLRGILNSVYEPTNERQPEEESLADLLKIISQHLLSASERTVTEHLDPLSREGQQTA